ncbi:MAG: hypothetical protein LH619_07405 [Chitinophagaceae bacterium]|nr:hypothetical protein [Chitinophagaceae bacterium]
MTAIVRHINILFFMYLYQVATAQPSVQSATIINGQKVFKDIKNPNLYYHLPADYKLAADASGKPFFSLIQMRYAGTNKTADAGIIKYNNLVQFKISADGAQQRKIQEAATELKRTNPLAELRMLPVRKFYSILVFASTADRSNADTTDVINAGVSENSNEQADVNNSYWNERTVSVRLTDADAQLVETALQKNQSLLSFSYAMYAAFTENNAATTSITGSNKLKKRWADHFQHAANPGNDTASTILLAKADVIDLGVDIVRWPSLIQKVDINERLPARYALFDVYCYDFNNEIRADLFEKKMEIKATSVNGKEITATLTFKQSQPEIYARSIRFGYAVRFDKPFYYRVSEINHDGDKVTTDWIQKEEWGALIDITSSPDKIVLKPKEQEQ